MNNLFAKLFLVVSVVILSGCIASTTIPARTQTGDLVYINLGGIKRNANGAPPSLSNISVTITDASNNTYPVKLEKRFNLFPSYTSKYSLYSQRKNDGYINGELNPYDGAFYIIARLAYPGAGTPTPLPLATGPAVIKVISAGLIQTTVSEDSAVPDGHYDNIPVEIIAGTANRDAVDTVLGGLDFYQNSSNRVVSSSNESMINNAYGMTVKATCPTSYSGLIFVPVSHDPNLILTQKITTSGSNYIIEASLINPKGFKNYSDPSWQSGMSTPSDLKIALTRNGSAQALSSCTLDSANSYYVDANGNRINGVNAVMAAASN